jgi:alcohol dehydrogenase class IV
MRYNTPAVPEKSRRVAVAIGSSLEGLAEMEAASLAWRGAARLVSDLGLPRPSDLEIPHKDLPLIAKACTLNMSSGGNPRPMAAGDYLSLIQESLDENLW